MKLDDQDCFLIRAILRKLDNLKIYGGKHKSIVRVYRSVPAHLRGRAKDIVNYLIKKELLIEKPTTEDLHIHLNEKKSKIIQNICQAETPEEIKNILEN